MNKKHYLIFAFIVLMGYLGDMLNAQQHKWRDTFLNGQTYCPGSNQFERWTTWRQNIDTVTVKYIKLSINGQFASSAITCNDPAEVRRIAMALKNGISYTVLCNSYYWQVSAAGSCSAGGCVSSRTSDVVHLAAETTAPPGSPPACWCQSNQIRPTIGNLNWGGIGGTSCNASGQWMEAYFDFELRNFDIGTTGFTPLDMCLKTQNVRCTMRNNGRRDIDSFEYGYSINATNYGPFKSVFKFRANRDSVYTLQSNFAFTNNTLYNFLLWVRRPNNQTDSNRTNDTARFRLDFRGPLAPPDTKDTAVCGTQRVTLNAKTVLASDSVIWYLDRLGRNTAGFGKRFVTNTLVSGAKYKFFCATYNGFLFGTANKDFSFSNYWPGNMFNIRVKARDLLVDSLHINMFENFNPVGQNRDVKVWIRQGGYNGFENNSGAWTLAYDGVCRARGNQRGSMVPVKMNLKSNTTYGVYVLITDGLLFNPGSGTTSFPDLDIQTGTANQSGFGTFLTNYDWDGRVFYRIPLCPSSFDSSEVTVKRLPIGASATLTNPSQLAPINSGNGSLAKPFAIAFDDTLRFRFNAPTGYWSAEHGTKWSCNPPVLRTSKGTLITTNHTWTAPSSGDSGTFVFSPAANWEDTIIQVSFTFKDIGKTNCDSTIRFWMYVPPLPVPAFTRSIKICDGDNVVFKNNSTIRSGFLNHKWYFGNGDTTDASDPIYSYPQYGTYIVRYDAISGLYGYIRSKFDTLTVTQIPVVDFKVINACEKYRHQFINNTRVNAGTLSYIWNFGDGSPTVTTTNPTYLYTLPKKYAVTLTATANGCSKSLTKSAYLFPVPKAGFTIPTGVKFCSSNEFQLTNTSTLLNGNLGSKWDMGDQTVLTQDNPEHTYANGGAYTIKLVSISEFGCKDSISKPITIQQGPKVDYAVSATCDQTPTQFTNNTVVPTGVNASNNWLFGDGNSSAAASPSHQYRNLGPKKVKLIVRFDNGCADSLEKNIQVSTQAIVDFDAKDNCSGKPVQFENKTTFAQGNIDYNWDFGDVTTSTAADPVHIYSTATTKTYVVTLKTKVDGLCEATKTKQVTIYELPNPNFTVEDAWTPGYGFRTIKVTAVNNSYPFYRFKFSDGGSLTNSSGFYQFGFDGYFDVTLCVRNAADCEACSTLSKAIQNSMSNARPALQSIKIFPNPNNGKFTITAASTIKKVEVANLVGETVLSNSVLKGNLANIELNNFSTGVYLVKVYTEFGVITEKITLNR